MTKSHAAVRGHEWREFPQLNQLARHGNWLHGEPSLCALSEEPLTLGRCSVTFAVH